MKPHRVDLISAFFGIVFLGLGITILADHGDVSLRYLGVLGPILVVAFGLVLVAAAVRRQRPEPQRILEEPRSYSSDPVGSRHYDAGEAPLDTTPGSTVPLQRPEPERYVEEEVAEDPGDEA